MARVRREDSESDQAVCVEVVMQLGKQVESHQSSVACDQNLEIAMPMIQLASAEESVVENQQANEREEFLEGYHLVETWLLGTSIARAIAATKSEKVLA
mmetsp:Transcript_61171/g.97099  ORF Transcript_61171/g.97099 Transcript_61171/m.97099 type:complete len:99 (+) Transcript_61171:1721-2017(+)